VARWAVSRWQARCVPSYLASSISVRKTDAFYVRARIHRCCCAATCYRMRCGGGVLPWHAAKDTVPPLPGGRRDKGAFARKAGDGAAGAGSLVSLFSGGISSFALSGRPGGDMFRRDRGGSSGIPACVSHAYLFGARAAPSALVPCSP